jgi:hypothetical protein
MKVNWHPVSENPPTEDEYIGSGVYNGKRWVGAITWDGHCWGNPDTGWECNNITHWSSDWPEPPDA